MGVHMRLHLESKKSMKEPSTVSFEARAHNQTQSLLMRTVPSAGLLQGAPVPAFLCRITGGLFSI